MNYISSAVCHSASTDNNSKKLAGQIEFRPSPWRRRWTRNDPCFISLNKEQQRDEMKLKSNRNAKVAGGAIEYVWERVTIFFPHTHATAAPPIAFNRRTSFQLDSQSFLSAPPQLLPWVELSWISVLILLLFLQSYVEWKERIGPPLPSNLVQILLLPSSFWKRKEKKSFSDCR